MNAPRISCEVYVDGARLADDLPSWDVATPTALAGLAVTWGRDGPLSQPDVGSLSFTVADKDGDTEFLGLLHVGRLVEVRASAAIGVSGTNAAIDPGFATDPRNRVFVYGPAGWAVADDPAMDAVSPPGHSLRFTAGGTAAASLFVPPGPFSPNPGQWTPIPQASAGETWRLTLMVRAGPFPYGQTAWRVVGFTDSAMPASESEIQYIGLTNYYVQPPNAWFTVDETLTMPIGTGIPYPLWLGIEIIGGWRPSWATISAAVTWATVPAGSWADCDRLWLDQMGIYPPAEARIIARVFAGRITDMTASAMGTAVQVAVTASEWTAEMANQNVGDTPWLAERLDTRANRIAALVATPPTLLIDARVAPYVVSWRDVDSQPAYGLLQDLAVSGDAVLWPLALDELWFEDPDTRASASTLTQDPDTGIITITGARSSRGIVITSCEVLRDPLQLVQTVEDVITRVDVEWQDQTLDDTGHPAPTSRTVTVADATAQAQYGLRKLGVTTQLTKQADASALANRALVRSRADAWHTNGVAWDTDLPEAWAFENEIAALELLDMARRVGLLLTITGVPAWVPLGPDLSAYVEGGQYTYSGGRWMLDLTLSPSTYAGQSAAWRDINAAYQWQQFAITIQWWDMWGVGGTARGRGG